MNAKGDLRIESLQDSNSYEAKGSQAGISAEISIGNAWNVGGNVSAERGKSRYKQVNEQAGLFAGDGGYQIEANNTHLTAGAIASTNPNNSELSTNRFTFEDIRNESSHKATSASISGSYGKGKDYYLDKDTGKLSKKGAENAVLVEGKTAPSFSPGLPMHSQGSDSSTTRATLTEGKITLNKDTTPTQTSANALGINTDLSQANSQVEKPKEVKKLLVEQKEIAQAVGHISQAANVYANNKAKETQDVEWQEGGSKRRKLDAAVATIGAILSGGSAGQVAAAAISPELNAQIHKLTEDSKTLNLLAHALLSAAEAHLSGANALAGAASGVAGEASAMFLSEVVFNKPAEQLSDEERTIIKVASQLSGAVVGNVAGGNTSSTILGAETAKRAVENNYLSKEDWKNYFSETRACDGDKQCLEEIKVKYDNLDKEKQEMAESACKIMGSSEECNHHVKQAEEGLYYGKNEIYKWFLNNPSSKWIENKLESGYRDSLLKPSIALLGAEQLSFLEKLSANPKFIEELKRDPQMKEEYRKAVDSAVEAMRNEISNAYEFDLASNISKLEKIVGRYEIYGKTIPLQPVYPELWLMPFIKGGKLATTSLESGALKVIANQSPKIAGFMEKYPLLAEMTTTAIANTAYQFTTNEPYDPYSLLGSELSTVLTRNRTLGQQLSINLGISTLSAEKNEDYVPKALGAGLGTLVGSGIMEVPIKDKYGNLLFKPILSNIISESINNPNNFIFDRKNEVENEGK